MPGDWNQYWRRKIRDVTEIPEEAFEIPADVDISQRKAVPPPLEKKPTYPAWTPDWAWTEPRSTRQQAGVPSWQELRETYPQIRSPSQAMVAGMAMRGEKILRPDVIRQWKEVQRLQGIQKYRTDQALREQQEAEASRASRLAERTRPAEIAAEAAERIAGVRETEATKRHKQLLLHQEVMRGLQEAGLTTRRLADLKNQMDKFTKEGKDLFSPEGIELWTRELGKIRYQAELGGDIKTQLAVYNAYMKTVEAAIKSKGSNEAKLAIITKAHKDWEVQQTQRTEPLSPKLRTKYEVTGTIEHATDDELSSLLERERSNLARPGMTEQAKVLASRNISMLLSELRKRGAGKETK